MEYRSVPDYRKWYILGILTLINIMGSIDRGVISVIAEPLKHEFGLSDAQIGVLGGLAYSVTYAIAVLPSGWMIDRWNRRNLLGITVAIWSGLTALCAAAPSYMLLLLARLGVGAAEAPTVPGTMSLIADTFPPHRRNTAISIYYAGVALGQIVIFLIGGWLLLYFGWRMVFLVAGVPSILLAVLMLFTTREPERGAMETEARPRPAESLAPIQHRTLGEVGRSLWTNRPLMISIPAIALCSGVPYAVTTWSTSYFVRVHHMSVSEGLIWTGIGFGLFMAAGSLLVGPIADRYSRGDPSKLALVPAVTTALAIAAGLLMLLGRTSTEAIIGLGLFSFMCGFFVRIRRDASVRRRVRLTD
jgi:MFS family permease